MTKKESNNTASDKRYIIIRENLFTENDWERLGCDLFLKNGYEVFPVCLLRGSYQGSVQEMQRVHHISIPTARWISNTDELEDAIGGFRPQDLVLNLALLSASTAWLYRYLTDKRIDYAVASLAQVCFSQFRHRMAARSTAHFLREKYRDALSSLHRWQNLAKLICNRDIGYPSLRAPRWWLRAGDYFLWPQAYFPKPWAAELIQTHAFDYEADEKAALVEDEVFPGQNTSRYAVFLDQSLADNPDWTYAGLDFFVDPKTYFANLNHFFSEIEKKYNVEVVVAAHPKGNYSETNNPFDGRKFFFKKSPELVRKCRFTLTTYSTAVNFSIIHQKPVCLITTDRIDRTPLATSYVSRLASWLKAPCVNIDRRQNAADLPDLKVDELAFAAFERSFIRGQKAENLPIFEALRQRFEISQRKNDERS